MLFAELILPFPLEKLFTYRIPKDWEEKASIGKRAIVQFGKKRYYTAIIREIHQNKPTEYETKEIEAILDEKPLINIFQLKLWDWISDYYLCSLGEVFKAALPSGLKMESETKILFNTEFNNYQDVSEKEKLLIEVIKNHNIISVKDFSSITDQKNIIPVINSLLNKGAVFLEEKLKEGFKPKSETFIQLNKDFKNQEKLNKVFDELKNAPKQLEVLMNYIHLSGILTKSEPDEINRKSIINATSSGTSSLNSLLKKEILHSYKKETNPFPQENINISNLNPLNIHQEEAYKKIKSQFKEKDIVLLHGITSSGKTEIYIHLIKEQLNKGKQVLYLLPEIALTTQIITRLKNIFGNKVGIYHSKYNDTHRVGTYKNILKNDKDSFQIILGVRSSLFLPFSNLGLIIIDEEHENTYKQYDPQPRYQARDSAIVLSSIHKAKTILGTATPAIESYFNAKNKKFGFVELTKRFKDILLPEIILVDTKRAYQKKLMKSHFSSTLLEQISEALSVGKQIILFQNRRGFSSFLECKTCNWIPQCKNCDVSLTYHKSFNKLNCHYCGYTNQIPKSCPACGGSEIQTRGFGTEKIEDEIQIFFPQAKIARMDLDVARSRKSYENIIHDFESKNIDILVGTQIISKGLDFENVSIVGILNADNMLNFPDFRAFERSFQLMTQVSGRAGRKKEQGKVVIQSSNPYHPILQNILNNDYKGMYEAEMKERKIFKYPPYYRLIKITVKHKKTDILNKASNSFGNNLKSIFGTRVLGPEAPIISKIQNYYLKNIILKIEKDKSLPKAKNLLKQEIKRILTHQEYKSLQINIDVDPI